MSKKKIILYSFLFLLITTSISLILCNRSIDNAAKGKLYITTHEIPYNKVGLLLGTSKFLKSGYPNYYYKYRIDAALELYKTHKIKYIVISGDNSRKDYNEPALMKADLISAGVDSTVIYLDYAGFRTLDSMIRLKEIFGQDSATVISQQFHNERALYIASLEGISAIGFNAKDVNKNMGLKTQLREKFARVKVFVDYLTGKGPKFLGPKVLIPE